MATAQQQRESLSSLSSNERLKAYQTIVDGCHHIWSKDRLQDGTSYTVNGVEYQTEDRLTPLLNSIAPLIEQDPYFLAHLTSYVIKKSEAKDLRVILTFLAALSTADGTPFSPGSSYKKPYLRYIAAAALQTLDPKLAARVLELSNKKIEVKDLLNNSRHFPYALRTAFKKYVHYREQNIGMIRGIKKAGLGNVMKDIYRSLHMGPTDAAASILRWKQKDREIEMEKSLYAEFKDLTDLQIAEAIRSQKLPVLGVIGALPRGISPVIAVALLEQATGNQSVILRKTFEDAGVLTDPEVMELYKNKVSTAKTSLDRAATLSKDASEAVKKVLSEARSEQRKEQTKGLGKVYLHLDLSGSMNQVVKFAIERGSIFAECVDNPEENFAWGVFDVRGEKLPLPKEFVQDAFAEVLFAHRGGWGGGTDAFALYPTARLDYGSDIDVFITDQGHNWGNLEARIRDFHNQHPNNR